MCFMVLSVPSIILPAYLPSLPGLQALPRYHYLDCHIILTRATLITTLPLIPTICFKICRSMSLPKPTYGELIQMLESAEGEAKISEESVPELLLSYSHHQYPFIPIGRASRFYDTVQKIAASTRSSARVKQLDGSPLHSYLKRVWMPRIRNTQQGIVKKEKSVSVNFHRVHTYTSCRG